MSVLKAFYQRAAQCPEAVAISDGAAVRTYGWMATAVHRMAEALRKGGCFECPEGHVPRVALDCPNGTAHVLWALAIVQGGGCLVPVPGELKSVEREELLRRTACVSIVRCNGDEENVDVDGFSARVEQLRVSGEPKIPEDEFTQINPVLIRFSSGTTGDAKGVVLSHESLIERIASGKRRLGITGKDRVLWVLPMAHHFAVSILLYLSQGATTILCSSRLADDMLDAALANQATVFYGSPFHMAVLAGEPSGRDWPGLRLAVSTASPLRWEVADSFLKRFKIPITQGYGIIEAGLPLLNTCHAIENPLACGIPDDFQVKLMDGDVQGDEGELWLKGPGMFDAYLSPWCKSEEVMCDGWFRSGDLATRAGDGLIRLAGRLKSVINVGGMKCFPEEIESVLMGHPGVRACRVVAMPDQRWGTVPAAEIIPVDPRQAPSETELSIFCSHSLASYKVPVFYSFVESLQKTASGKIKRL